ncbi:trans-isoprenyl diphosphate synthase [Syntrophotalea carbinolica DSM 2380]|uniref:Trans-isoprenyl diphosphate synthase n=1 Tax=Syntrophotalea carbinolica (strain DSM 2380 / NBRC 103641 / GraBd1) TaxID=338963 RepID=Q3A3Z5_SYNC1|nr:farnesyl diphosphate synthase [Syntrophotalea carbinolica]ABA88912.1 trans-isoprenyl diphosphate synthase [Syntrophotalea carbinolica DSM 2380]
MDLNAYLKERRAQVDKALDTYLPGEDVLPISLHKAMRYSTFAAGKRIRPILMMAACEAVGGTVDKVMPAACAMEMIHTYSLIHDDLPAMDDDDFRRGRPTCHKVYGDALAILAGDALLTEAFILLSRLGEDGGVSLEAARRVSADIARCAGSMGMVGGQVVDMDSEGKEIDLATLEYIHTRKTGALILASVQSGAVLGGASSEQVDNLGRYAKAAGLAFQVADDILDIVGDQELLGKDVGSDQERGKATYPALLGLDAARDRAKELRDVALESLSGFDERAEPLRSIAHYIVDRSF